jgi:hypothetical protein
MVAFNLNDGAWRVGGVWVAEARKEVVREGKRGKERERQRRREGGSAWLFVSA